MIKYDRLPKSIKLSAYSDENLHIVAIVDYKSGRVMFEGYIDDEYVPYSRTQSIIRTAACINDVLAARQGK